MEEQKSISNFKGTIPISRAAEILGVSPMTLRRWEQNGLLKPIRMGTRNDRRYRREDIKKILQKGTK